MANLTFIGKCQNGKNVFDRFNSHWHSDVSKDVLLEALSKLSPNNEFHTEVVDMKYIIGKNSCVEVTKDDDIVYVIRKGKKGPTPMVKNKPPIDCSLLTIILKQIAENDYILITAYIGEGKPEPWDPRFYNQKTWERRTNFDKEDYQRAVEFWKTHALVYSEADISLHLSY